jgi:crotonobetainyl-CoA:carnitine CoA-transferase CaiB-like acyl-CoA transferase
VLDLAGEIGVYCTKLLADLGADVIRIEPPDGDPLRDIGPFWHDERAADRSLSFLNFNTNKRSVTLDIAQPEGRALLEQLIARRHRRRDVRAGLPRLLGLGYAGLNAIRPASSSHRSPASGRAGRTRTTSGATSSAWR